MRYVHALSSRINRAIQWPCSIPQDFHGVDSPTGPWAWKKAGLSMLFHVAHAIGRVVGLVLRGTPGVLVIRTDSAGDALLFEPVLQSLGQRFSPRELHLWAPTHTCDLLRACPSIHRRAALPGGEEADSLACGASPWWRMVLGYRLGRWRFEMAMYPSSSPDPLGHWLMRSVRAAQRWYCWGDVGHTLEPQDPATARSSTLLLERSAQGHELERNAQLARQWQETELRAPKVHLDDQARRSVEDQMIRWRRLRDLRSALGLVGVIPSASLSSKQYPIDRWASALRIIWEQDRLMPALLGGPDDQGTLDALRLALKEVPCLKLERPLDFLSLSGLIGRMDAVIGVETGLTHSAVVQQIPTVVIRTGAAPGRYFPWPGAAPQKVLNLPLPCDGCQGRCVHEKPLCITEIAPEQIVMALRSLLAPKVVIDLPRRTFPLAKAG